MKKQTINLGAIDLDTLPKRKSVYAIFASSSDKSEPINCRYVGETDNLEERTKAHLADSEQNECLRNFLQSNKVALMIYELLPDSDKKERLEKELEWIKIYSPECNK